MDAKALAIQLSINLTRDLYAAEERGNLSAVAGGLVDDYWNQFLVTVNGQAPDYFRAIWGV